MSMTEKIQKIRERVFTVLGFIVFFSFFATLIFAFGYLGSPEYVQGECLRNAGELYEEVKAIGYSCFVKLDGQWVKVLGN